MSAEQKLEIYKVWEEYDDEETASEIEAYDAESAAEIFFERRYGYENSLEVALVRAPDGELCKVEVEMRMELEFFGRRIPWKEVGHE